MSEDQVAGDDAMARRVAGALRTASWAVDEVFAGKFFEDDLLRVVGTLAAAILVVGVLAESLAEQGDA